VKVPYREAPNHNVAGVRERAISRGLTFFRHNLAFYRENRAPSIGYDRGRPNEIPSTNG
jgi:hypothetical protein